MDTEPTAPDPAPAGEAAEQAFYDGVMAQLAGDPALAERHYRQALELAGDHPGALHHLAILLVLQDRRAPALALLERALHATPEIAALWLTLGDALHGLGRDAEAVGALERAIALSPPYPDAENLLGVVLLALDRPEAALAHFAAALTAAPTHAEAIGNLGYALHKLGRDAEAVLACEAALGLRPDSLATLQTLGAALHGLGRYDDALARFRSAAAIKPDDADLHYDIGVILTELGQLDEALAALDRAIALDPAAPRYYRARALFGLEASHLATLETLARDAGQPGSVRIDLHFALGKAYADLGRPDAAIAQWLDGNRLKRASFSYDEAATLEMVARIRREFTAERLRRSGGDPSARPVFIIGMLRSGSTLIEQILASHPGIFGAGEITAFPEALAATLPGQDYPELVRAVTDGQLAALGADYARRLEGIAPGAGLVTDKMLANFMFAGLIHLALPRARIIHARRDPLDTCLSCFSKLFAARQPFSYDLGELGRYYRAYQGLMAHWRETLPAGVMLEVDYAALIADPEGQARRMLGFLGLDWDPACLSFHRTARPARTTSMVEVRRPIYRDSIGRSEAYRPYLGALLDGLAGKPAR